MAAVRTAVSRADALRCFPVFAQLRPHLTEGEFLRRWKVQAREGYRLAFVEHEAAVVAVAGFRIHHMMFQKESGRLLYVDDLVTDDASRSSGHGRLLLKWLADEARRNDCDALELDSGVQRVGAHRFYLGQGMHIGSYHFRMPLKSEPPRALSFPAAAPAPPRPRTRQS